MEERTQAPGTESEAREEPFLRYEGSLTREALIRSFREQGILFFMRYAAIYLGAVLAWLMAVSAFYSIKYSYPFFALLYDEVFRNEPIFYAILLGLLGYVAVRSIVLNPRRQTGRLFEVFGDGGPIGIVCSFYDSFLRIAYSGSRANESTDIEYGRVRKVQDRRFGIVIRTEQKVGRLIYRDLLRPEDVQAIMEALKERCPALRGG